MHDLRFAARLLLRSPGHSVTALLALALGLGATVAIFSAAWAVLYRPLPVLNPSRVVIPVSVNTARGLDRASVPYADYADWRELPGVFDSVAVYQPTGVDVAGEPAPERAQAAIVSEDYFSVLRTAPVLGRGLQPGDHRPDAPRAVVLGDGLWRRRFASDPGIVGREVRIAGLVMTVAGVVPSDGMWPLDVDVWLPLRESTLPDDVRTRRDNMIFQSVARLAEGTTIDEARVRVRALAARIAAEHGASRQAWTSDLLPLNEALVEPEVRAGLIGVMAGSAVVLLIACLNLANLLLARGADRAREVAVRAAMGASRRRILRQLLIENALLAAIGSAAGLAVAWWLTRVIALRAADVLPRAETIRLDVPGMAAAAALAVGTMILFGVAPALTTSASGAFGSLREGRGVAGGGRARRLRDALVVVELAMAIVLLAAAGLTVRSFLRLLDVDPGVDVDRVLTGRVAVPGARYPTAEARLQFWESVLEEVRRIPGVETVAAASFVPAGARGFGLGRVFLLEGQPEPPASSDHPANWNVITPDYFRAVGIRVLQGRAFDIRDTAAGRPVIVINETMARRVFGDRSPLGVKIRSWRDENVLREIVGVVSDVRYQGIADDQRSLVYVPHAQNPYFGLTLVVRAAGDPAALAPAVRRAVAARDPDIAVAELNPLSVAARRSIAAPQFAAWLFGLFAAAAAVLSALGIYGVLAYAVSRRSHEMAVRLALGATPAAVSRLVVRQGLLLTAIGTAIGLAGALAVGRVMRGILYGIEPSDPVTFVLVPVLLGAIALAACALPARRAARIEPLTALRTD